MKRTLVISFFLMIGLSGCGQHEMRIDSKCDINLRGFCILSGDEAYRREVIEGAPNSLKRASYRVSFYRAAELQPVAVVDISQRYGGEEELRAAWQCTSDAQFHGELDCSPKVASSYNNLLLARRTTVPINCKDEYYMVDIKVIAKSPPFKAFRNIAISLTDDFSQKIGGLYEELGCVFRKH